MATNSHNHGGSVPHTDRAMDAPDTPDMNVTIDPEALKRGHEPDNVNLGAIMKVPLAIVGAFILAYTVVSLIIGNVKSLAPKPADNSPAAKRNEATLNDRLGRISSSDPHADVKQPRLEGLEELTSKDPQHLRSSLPTASGNSPHYHPEDLRPSGKWGKELGLDSYSWKEKDKVVRIPVKEAMHLVLTDKKYLKSAEKSGKPVALNDLLPPGPGANFDTAPKAPVDDRGGKH